MQDGTLKIFKRENCTQKVQFNRPTKENACFFLQNLRDILWDFSAGSVPYRTAYKKFESNVMKHLLL